MRGGGHVANHSNSADVDDDKQEKQEVGQSDDADRKQKRHDHLIRIDQPTFAFSSVGKFQTGNEVSGQYAHTDYNERNTVRECTVGVIERHLVSFVRSHRLRPKCMPRIKPRHTHPEKRRQPEIVTQDGGGRTQKGIIIVGKQEP